jgi:septal ring factor EnvC (AmiA/AmiB activator)
MSPVSRKEEIWGEITRCATEIQNIKDDIKDLTQQLVELRKERKDDKNRMSDRRLAIYIGIASFLSAIAGSVITWVLTKL